jgi:hypothetical protein
MADSDSTHDIRNLKPSEIDALGDRMLARAVSCRFTRSPT